MADEKKFVRNWYLGMGLAGVVVAVVAALLLAIIGTARSILRNATHALDVAEGIVVSTEPIWQLELTNAVAAQLLDGAQSIEQHATQIADALEAPEQPEEVTG
jgi:hypothetical protein